MSQEPATIRGDQYQQETWESWARQVGHGMTRHLFMLRLVCHGSRDSKRGGGEEGDGCMISRWKGRNTTATRKGGVGWSGSWLRAVADWPESMVSKTAVPFPCIGLAWWQGCACLAHQPLHFAGRGGTGGLGERKAHPRSPSNTLMSILRFRFCCCCCCCHSSQTRRPFECISKTL